MLKPPIARLGGKSRSRKQIIEMIPGHICYVELFTGAGWVFFGKEPSKVEVINDIDGELINMFNMFKLHGPEIERLLKFEICSRDQFENYKNIDTDQQSDIQKAINFYTSVSYSFASKGNHYGYGKTRPPKAAVYDFEKLQKIRERLKNTYVENLSYEKIIDKYDSKDSFFFVDPPYYNTANDFSRTVKLKPMEFDHRKLHEKIKQVKGKFLLTINDEPFVRELYKDYNVYDNKVLYSVSSKSNSKLVNEIIITNYTVGNENRTNERFPDCA